MNQFWRLILAFFFITIYFTFQCEPSSRIYAESRRTTRSPDSERIQRWKLAFSGDLAPLHRKLPTVTCNWALQELCLKHVSCRELWALFRRNCLVDAQNNCLMTNKNDCWQSFEGISWTGLGSCACPGNNSDCHWIRLQTNYNKCVYLLNHDTNWHAELNSPAQFYAINGHQSHRNYSGEFGVERWKLEQIEKQQRSREEEEEERRRRMEAASEEEERQRRKRIEEEAERRREMKRKEEEEAEKEEEMRQNRAKEAEAERKKKAQQEERMKRIRAEEERKRKAKVAEEQRRRQMQQAEEERKKRRKEEEEEEREREVRMEARRRLAAVEEEMERRRKKQKEEEEEEKARKEEAEEEAQMKKRKKIEKEETKRRRMEGEMMTSREEEEIIEEDEVGIGRSQSTNLLHQQQNTGIVGSFSMESTRHGPSSFSMESTVPTTTSKTRAKIGNAKFSASSQANNGRRKNNKNIYYTTVDSDGEVEEIENRRGRPQGTKNDAGDEGGGGRWTPTTTTTTMAPQQIQQQRQKMHSSAATTTTMTHRSRVIVPTAEQLETQAEEPPTSTSTKIEAKNGMNGNGGQKSTENGNGGRRPHLSIQRDDPADQNKQLLANVEGERPIPTGTCSEVLAICERDESACKWHLSELLIKCPSAARFDPCQRSAQCSAALSRFVRFVPAPLAEAMLFCSPNGGEEDQKMPIVLLGPLNNQSASNCSTISSSSSSTARRKPKARWTCTQTGQMCRAEPNCNRRLSALRSACPFSPQTPQSPPACSAQSMAKCRAALAAIRGTWLDEPCHCSSGGASKKAAEECRKWQWTQWPGNPCIEEVRREFNDLFLAGQLQIEPPPTMHNLMASKSTALKWTTKAPSLAITKATASSSKSKGGKSTKMEKTTTSTTTTKTQKLGMELGEEVSLLPAENDPEEEAGKNVEEEEGKPNRTGAKELLMREKLDAGENGGKLTKKTTKMTIGGGSGEMGGKKRTKFTSTTTTTTVMTTPFAEELVDDDDDEEFGIIGEDDELGKKEGKGLLKENNGGRLSYELADQKGQNENERNKSSANKSSKNAVGNSSTTTTTTTTTSTTPKPSPADVAHWGEFEQQQMATTGRQPLPEFDFVTQKPPIEGDGCQTRNLDGEWVEHYPDSVFREFHDWAGRCSSWCVCSPSNGSAKCHSLGCLSDVLCEARQTTVVFGQRLYLGDRGACQCHDGRFICDSSELRPQLGPGLYLSLGYSKAELDLIRQKVPKPILERSGLISQSTSAVKDLATRLQFALERILPQGMKCRVALLEHFPPEQVVLYQVQWFGVDSSVNNSREKWHSGKMEKHCSAYVRELELTFLLERAPRYQLLLSTIKQIRVIDLLDALPPNSARINAIISFKFFSPILFHFIVIFLLFS